MYNLQDDQYKKKEKIKPTERKQNKTWATLSGINKKGQNKMADLTEVY
jgi:hypothetical protein